MIGLLISVIRWCPHHKGKADNTGNKNHGYHQPSTLNDFIFECYINWILIIRSNQLFHESGNGLQL